MNAARSVDLLADYAELADISVGVRTVIMEGDTDVDLLNFAARVEMLYSKRNLLGDELVITSCGRGTKGDIYTLASEFSTLHNIARRELNARGKKRYRLIAVVDNDEAGRKAVNGTRQTNQQIKEFRDIFKLHPVMPISGNLDSKALEKTFSKLNQKYKGLDWEIEDFLDDEFLECFTEENPGHFDKCGCVAASGPMLSPVCR